VVRKQVRAERPETGTLGPAAAVAPAA